jgi:hypothetical protein
MAAMKKALNKPSKSTPTKTVKQPARLGGKSVKLTGKAAVANASSISKGKVVPTAGSESAGTSKTTKTAKGTKLQANKTSRRYM